jgi:hypothetical protein
MPDMPQNIPPQVLQALQQQSQGMNGGDITAILAQLAQMSPDELSQALAQLGVNIPPEQLVSGAENWLEGAAGKQAGEEEDTETAPTAEPVDEGDDTEEQPTPTTQAEAGDTEGEAAPAEEGEDAAIPQNAQPTGYTPQRVPQAAPAAMPPPQEAQAMPAGIPPGAGRMPPSAAMARQAAGGSSQMDALIEAALTQGNAPIPNGPRMPRMSSGPPMPSAPTSKGNVRAPSMRSKKRG